MDIFVLFVLIFGALLGALRCADILLWTDTVSGLCTFGSVWWRYAALLAAALLSAAAGRWGHVRHQPLYGRHPLAAAAAFVGAVCFAAAGVVRAAAVAVQLAVGYFDAISSIRVALELLCAVWFVSLGAAFVRRGEWRSPAGGLPLAVLGGLIFYWRVLARFMENSSSWHRVYETAQVWQLLAALVFLTALTRAIYLPDTADAKTLCAAALAAYCLCLCWGLPQLACIYSLQELLFNAGMCCVGAAGGVCAAVCGAEPRGKHSSIG